MLKEERLVKICEILEKEKFVSVEMLAERLYFSLPTIRRDLAQLAKEGKVKRSHGGALLQDNTESDVPIQYRSTVKHSEKAKMCALAAELIGENYVIFIDGSTTAFSVCTVLPTDKNLTVITNSIPVCTYLGNKNIRTYCTGGILIPESQAFAGSRAEAFVRSFSADIMFFSSSALGFDGKITDYSDMETSLRKAMLENSICKVFLCDESKFGKKSTFVLTQLSEVDHIVTDLPLPESFGEDGRKKNIYI